MPSGAKKRKAAKKKKGAQPNTNNPNPSPAASTHDVKHQDDRQSDVGEASSTASQDNPSHHDLLTEGEEEKIENRENAPQVEGVKIEGDNDVVVEGNAIKIEDEFGGKYEHDETERKSYDGGSSGSSSSSNSSSSDDESHGVKSSRAVIDTVPTVMTGEVSEAVVDSVPPVVSDKVSLLSESLEVNTSSPSVSKENGEKKGSTEEQVGGSETFYDAEATTPSVEYVEAASDLKTCAAEETDERLSLSYNAPIATHDNRTDLEKDSGVTEPLLVTPPRPVQTTSWKGCCGLFELFTGSAR